MRQTWVVRVAAPVLAAAALAACSQHVNENDGSDRRKYAGGSRDQVIALKGCVEGAANPDEFVLRNVQLEPIPSQPTDAATGPGVSVTEGSSVRLKITDSDQLKKNLGQIVSVTGLIVDDGRSTIGTGGKPRDPDQQEQPSDALARGHVRTSFGQSGAGSGTARPRQHGERHRAADVSAESDEHGSELQDGTATRSARQVGVRQGLRVESPE